MDDLKISQLTKELVAEELRRMGDPCGAAAVVVCRTLTVALPAAKDPEPVIVDAVKGGMTALLLADQSLARGAILLLEAVLQASGEANLDPTESMKAALKGVASLKKLVEPARLDDIRLEIDAHYMGAGEVFVQYLRADDPVRVSL